jgi:hypothetical protein
MKNDGGLVLSYSAKSDTYLEGKDYDHVGYGYDKNGIRVEVFSRYCKDCKWVEQEGLCHVYNEDGCSTMITETWGCWQWERRK